MKSVGKLLRTARRKKNIDLDEVVEATKIKRKFLQALEKNNFRAISSPVAAAGFIKNYAEFLDLSSERLLALFRRDTRRAGKKEVIPQGIKEELEKSGLSWSPKTTFIAITLTIFFLLAAYLAYQYFSFASAPDLEVFQPQEGQQIETNQLVVFGRTDAGAVVKINGQPVSPSEDGTFRFGLDLLTGENKILVEAFNKQGKESRVERTVVVMEE
jgi:cytoskeletal protein RodZ